MSLGIREIQIKLTMMYQLILQNDYKQKTDNNCWQVFGEIGNFILEI